MKSKMTLIYAGLAFLLLITGGIVWKVISGNNAPVTPVKEEQVVEILPPVDASVIVTVKKSTSAANTVVMGVTGLAGKMTSIGYELSYESQGLVKGVNSGSKPIDVAGKETFERDIYLGTCSRNVCKPDAGVTNVSVVMEFTGTDGKKSQFSKDYDL
jgi:hypothetical protein